MALQTKGYATLVSGMLDALADKAGLTNQNIGSVTRTLVEALSGALNELYNFASSMLAEGYLDTADGYWLERRVAEFGLTRKSGQKAAGVATFVSTHAGPCTVTIPAGTLISTLKDGNGVALTFETIGDATLCIAQGVAAGTVSALDVPIRAKFEGSAYNLRPNTLTRLGTVVPGIDAVTNGDDWMSGASAQAGADPESDAELRQRALRAWSGLAAGGTCASYQALALGVPNVVKAWVNDRRPRGEGTVDLYIAAQDPTRVNGTTPTTALVNAVQAVIDANRPITVDALVRPAVSIDVRVEMNVTPLVGFDLETIRAEVTSRLLALFGNGTNDAVTALGFGQDVVRARLVALAMGVKGVYSARVESLAFAALTASRVQSTDEDGDLIFNAYELPSLDSDHLTLTLQSPFKD